MKKLFKKYWLKISNKGFSLVELILYIALVSIVLVGAISFAWNMIFLREKSVVQKISAQSGQLIMAEIRNVLSEATTAQVTGSQTLTTTQENGDTIVITLNGTNVEKTVNGGSAIILTSNQIEVTSLQFIDFSGTNQSKSITTNIELINKSSSPKFQSSVNLTHTEELRSDFNQSRSVLIDMSQTSLSANNANILNILLENTGTIAVTVTEITVSWQNGNDIVEIFGDSSSLWSGTASTGTQIDTTDQGIAVAQIVPFDFYFSGSMSGETVTIDFHFDDGSISKAEITLTSTITPTPTPTVGPTATPTPTPPPSATSCPEACTNSGNTGGVCRVNASWCGYYGEINIPAGDQFCTAGWWADTCCCDQPSSPTPTPPPSASSCDDVCVNNGYDEGTCRWSSYACTSNGETPVPAGNQFCTGGPWADTCCCEP